MRSVDGGVRGCKEGFLAGRAMAEAARRRVGRVEMCMVKYN